MVFDKLVLHVIEMSSEWSQFSRPQPICEQSSSAFSLPLQLTSSNHVGPEPAPNVLPIASPDCLNKYRNSPTHWHKNCTNHRQYERHSELSSRYLESEASWNHDQFRNIFYRAALNAGRYSQEKAVRPSVHPSVCQTRAWWQNGRKNLSKFYTIRKII